MELVPCPKHFAVSEMQDNELKSTKSLSGLRDHKYESMRHIMIDFEGSAILSERALRRPETRSVESLIE